MQNHPIQTIGLEGQQPMHNQGYGGPPQGQMPYQMGNNMMGGPPMYGNMGMHHGRPGYPMMRPYDRSMQMYPRPHFGHGRYPGPRYPYRQPVFPNMNQIYQEVQQQVGSG